MGMNGERSSSRAIATGAQRSDAMDPCMTASFWYILPTDIHICILLSWLCNEHDDGSLLMALSSLDIACCNRALRQPFLDLASCLIFPVHSFRNDCEVTVDDVQGLMTWLSSRRVALRSLFLNSSAQQQFTATPRTISSVCIGSEGLDTARQVLLACGPGLTSIRCSQRMTPNTNLTPLWDTLASNHFHQLERLVAPLIGVNSAMLVSVLTSNGQRLRELQLTNMPASDAILAAIAQCKQLDTLSVCVCGSQMDGIAGILHACCQLRKLVLESYAGDSKEELLGMLQVGKHLKEFHVTVAHGDMQAISCHVFSQLLAEHPWLDALGFQFYGYASSTRYLQLCCLDLDQDHLVRILSHCCPIKLTIRGVLYHGHQQLLSILGERLGGTLLELEWFNCTESVIPLVLQCRHLRRLRMHGMFLRDSFVHRLPIACRELQQLTWDNAGKGVGEFGDAAMEALFFGCRELREVLLDNAPDLSFRTLQAVLDNALHLEKLSWRASTVTSAEVERFKMLARDQGMLPVPVIALLCTPQPA